MSCNIFFFFFFFTLIVCLYYRQGNTPNQQTMGTAAMEVWPPLAPWYVPVGSVVVYLMRGYICFPKGKERYRYVDFGRYWITILVLKRVMKNREPLTLKFVSAVHNLIMALISLILAIGIVFSIV